MSTEHAKPANSRKRLSGKEVAPGSNITSADGIVPTHKNSSSNALLSSEASMDPDALTPGSRSHRHALSITLKLSLLGHHTTGLKQNPGKCHFDKKGNHKQATETLVRPRRRSQRKIGKAGPAQSPSGTEATVIMVTWTQWRARSQQTANATKPQSPHL